jgi:hypothetical protein
VLNAIEQQHVQVQNLHARQQAVLKELLSSQDARKIWDQMKLLTRVTNGSTYDISVDTARLAGGSW